MKLWHDDNQQLTTLRIPELPHFESLADTASSYYGESKYFVSGRNATV